MAVDWRSYADTTLETYIAEFTRVGSPMLGEAQAIWDAARPHSRLALAMLFMEGKYETLHDIPASYHNPFSLAKPMGGVGLDRWMQYSSFAQGTQAWRERITSPTYGNGIYARTGTLAELIHVFAPGRDNNNEALYVDTVLAKMGVFPVLTEGTPVATYKSYPVLWSAASGKTVMVESPAPIIQKLIPLSAARPGTKRKNPWKWVQHETGNPSVGANAEMHYRFLMGQLGVQTSFHFVVDDDQIIQLVPCDEVTWQAADGTGPGNYNGISCELCINSDANKALSRRNAEWLAGGVLKADEGTVADVTRHWDYNAGDPNRHHCPDLMMTEGYWPTFVANVGKIIAGGVTTPATGETYAVPILLDLGEWDGKDRTLPDGTVLRACKRVVKARTKTKRYQVGAITAPSIGPDLKKGDEATIDYVFQAKNGGARWAYTTYGTRLRLAHFDPYITITPKG